jgi:hypothetical protein
LCRKQQFSERSYRDTFNLYGAADFDVCIDDADKKPLMGGRYEGPVVTGVAVRVLLEAEDADDTPDRGTGGIRALRLANDGRRGYFLAAEPFHTIELLLDGKFPPVGRVVIKETRGRVIGGDIHDDGG